MALNYSAQTPRVEVLEGTKESCRYLLSSTSNNNASLLDIHEATIGKKIDEVDDLSKISPDALFTNSALQSYVENPEIHNYLQGVQGTQGVQGVQGIQGYSASSIQGLQGIQGPQGEKGVRGDAGPQGADGSIQMIQGTQGTDGYPGQNFNYSGTSNGYWKYSMALNPSDPTRYPARFVGYDGPQGTQGTQGREGLSIQGIRGAFDVRMYPFFHFDSVTGEWEFSDKDVAKKLYDYIAKHYKFAIEELGGGVQEVKAAYIVDWTSPSGPYKFHERVDGNQDPLGIVFTSLRNNQPIAADDLIID